MFKKLSEICQEMFTTEILNIWQKSTYGCSNITISSFSEMLKIINQLKKSKDKGNNRYKSRSNRL